MHIIKFVAAWAVITINIIMISLGLGRARGLVREGLCGAHAEEHGGAYDNDDEDNNNTKQY